MTPILHGLLLEALEISRTVAVSGKGEVDPARFPRWRAVSPYLLHPLKPPALLPLNIERGVLGLPVNRDYRAIAESPGAGWSVYENFPELLIADTPRIRLALDSDLSLFSDRTAPWLSRRNAKLYANRLELLIAALEVAPKIPLVISAEQLDRFEGRYNK